LNVSKDEAAARQLDVAIELFFENRDILAVFTVAQDVRLIELVANARTVVGALPNNREQAIAAGADLLRHQAAV